jgi:two-component system invasion response regulator UvrY
MANLVLVDDHVLLRNGLVSLIKSFGHEVLFEADNGKGLVEKLDPQSLPDIILLDINMPVMDGYETALWLKKNYPRIKVLALSMYDDETAIIRMLKCGAKGYVLKDIQPSELEIAIKTIMSRGYYYSDLINDKIVNSLNDASDDALEYLPTLNGHEIDFLKYCCTELTYKEIAAKMTVSPRTVDGYRDILFRKLGIKTRVGLAVYTIRNNIADPYSS